MLKIYVEKRTEKNSFQHIYELCRKQYGVCVESVVIRERGLMHVFLLFFFFFFVSIFFERTTYLILHQAEILKMFHFFRVIFDEESHISTLLIK